MSLDKIVVLLMAIAFFGGIAFVYWKNRQTEKKAGPTPSTSNAESVEDDSFKKLPEKRRKTSNS
jgi:hypothetical protein